MGFNTVTVTTTATKLVAANTLRESILLTQITDTTIYVGPDDTVTSSNGFPLKQWDIMNENNSGTKVYMGDIYGIVDSSTADVRYWERTRNG